MTGSCRARSLLDQGELHRFKKSKKICPVNVAGLLTTSRHAEEPRLCWKHHVAFFPSTGQLHPTFLGGISRLQTQRDGGGRTRHYFRLSADSRKPSRTVFIWVKFTNPQLAFGGWKLLFFPLPTCLYVPAEGLSADSSAGICGEQRAQPWGCAPGKCHFGAAGAPANIYQQLDHKTPRGPFPKKDHSHGIREAQPRGSPSGLAVQHQEVKTPHPELCCHPTHAHHGSTGHISAPPKTFRVSTQPPASLLILGQPDALRIS